MKDSSITILITVSSILERDKLIQRIYTNLTKEPSTTFTIIKSQVNKVQVFHNVGPQVRALIRTYLVLVVPVLIDLNPLRSVLGIVDFHLEETITQLENLTSKLRSMQGRRIVKGNTNGACNLLEQLNSCLG